MYFLWVVYIIGEINEGIGQKFLNIKTLLFFVFKKMKIQKKKFFNFEESKNIFKTILKQIISSFTKKN